MISAWGSYGALCGAFRRGTPDARAHRLDAVAPIGSGHSRSRSHAPRLTVVRGRGESMNMDKRHAGSMLCLNGVTFASLPPEAPWLRD
jgi:hypothetical protein